MLRGAFGRALKKLSCMTQERSCQDCPLFGTCPYPAIFSPPALEHKIQRFSQPPAPYLIEPEEWGARVLESGETLRFDMVLMGRASKELPLIAYAWQNAAKFGIGPKDGNAALTKIEYLPPVGSPVSLYRPGSTRLEVFVLQDLVPPPVVLLKELTLRFVSPLRLQENGHALSPPRLTPTALLMAAIRRVGLLSQIYGHGVPDWDFEKLARKASVIRDKKKLFWRDWTRHSSRQQCFMKLGGVTGEWSLFDDDTPTGTLDAFYPALYIGQWLHLGKETVFGLGRYYLEHESAG
jgi:hypothetical protein